MKKIILTTFALIFFGGFTQVAKAEDEKDMTKLTCQELLSDTDSIPYAIFWMDGYMSAISENPILSTEWIQEFTTHAVTYCHKNPSHTMQLVMESVE